MASDLCLTINKKNKKRAFKYPQGTCGVVWLSTASPWQQHHYQNSSFSLSSSLFLSLRSFGSDTYPSLLFPLFMPDSFPFVFPNFFPVPSRRPSHLTLAAVSFLRFSPLDPFSLTYVSLPPLPALLPPPSSHLCVLQSHCAKSGDIYSFRDDSSSLFRAFVNSEVRCFF